MNISVPSHPGIIAPPPLLYIGAFVSGAAVEIFCSKPIVESGYALMYFGCFFLVVCASFARWAFVTMRVLGTSANPRKQSVALSTSGPFAFSRNPIYLAMTGLYIGAATLLNSWWPLIFLVPLLILMHWGVVLREERYLLAQFGESYASYKATVRRWL